MARIVGFRNTKYDGTGHIYIIRLCSKCNAIIEFQSDTVFSDIERNEHHEYIKCPNCKNKIRVI